MDWVCKTLVKMIQAVIDEGRGPENLELMKKN